MEEEYRKIEGFEKYSVSNHGNVRNDETEQILKPRLRGVVYPYVCLCIDGIKYTKKIHRLVAQAFCENENNYNQVDHIDQNKTNNNYTNLRWVSQSQNIRNRKKKEGCSSTYLGIYFNNKLQKWKAQFQINRKKIYLGCYKTEDEAHQAFCKYVYDNNLEEFYPTNELHFTN